MSYHQGVRGNKSRAAINERVAELSLPLTESSCHVWYGSYSVHGYPVLMANNQQHRVARVLAGLWRGDARQANHSCHNDWCVNRQHIYIGTQLENMRDRWTGGRGLGRRVYA